MIVDQEMLPSITELYGSANKSGKNLVRAITTECMVTCWIIVLSATYAMLENFFIIEFTWYSSSRIHF